MSLEKRRRIKTNLTKKIQQNIKVLNYSFWDWFILAQFLGLFVFLVFYYEAFIFHKAIIAYSVFTSLLSLQLLKEKKLFIPKYLVFPFLLFFSGILLSTAKSEIFELSVFKLLFYISNLITFINAYSLSKKKERNIYIYFISFLLIGTFIVFLAFIKTYISDGQIKLHRTFIGPFYWHNQMAGFLLFFTPSILFLSRAVRGRALKIATLSLSVFLSFALFLTYSRAGIFIFFVSYLLIFSLNYLKSPKRNLSLSPKLKNFKKLLPIILLIISFFLIILSNQRLESKANDFITDVFRKEKTTSGNLRVSTYKSAFNMLKDHPITGVGLGVFGEAMYSYELEPWLYAKYTHNHFLQIFSEGGVITGLGFVLIILLVYKKLLIGNRSIIKTNKNSLSNIFKIAIFVSISTSVLHNIVDVDWNYPALAFLFWFFAGLSVGQQIKSRNDINLSISSRSLSLTIFVLLTLTFTSNVLGYFDRELNAGQISFKNEDYLTAKKHYEKAISIFPLSFRSFWGLGYVNIKLDNPDEAVNNFSMASKLNPFNAEPYFQKYLLEKNNTLTKSQAEENILEIVKLNKFAQPIYYTEAYRQYLGNNKDQEAFDILRLGSEKRFPINQSFKDFSYIYKGQPEFSGSLFDLHLSYAIALKNRGEEEKSQEIAQNALSIYDNNESFQNIMKSLEETEKNEGN